MAAETGVNDRKQACDRLHVPAAVVPVCTFHEILFWPFVLAEDDEADVPEDMAARMARIAKAIAEEPGWEPVKDLAHYLNEDDPAQKNKNTWVEIVYFHDFVQRAIFRKFETWPDARAPIHLLRNEDLKGVAVRIGKHTLHFSVSRLHLYLFSAGAAMLVLEVALERGCGQTATLADIQNFMDFFRRWHVPFWRDEDTPGYTPDEITWIWSDRKEGPFFPSKPGLRQSLEHLLDSEARAPLPLKHWRKLLPQAIRDHLAAVPKDTRQHSEPAAMHGLHWRAISDERMLTSNFIIIPKACFENLRESDWVRLCFADQAGKGWPYLICDGKWETFKKNHVFDWFHHEGTRQLFAGFNHVMVCVSDEFPKNILIHHFRHHYFQMALLAHFEYATLLSYSSRITRAVEALRTNGEAGFRERFIRIRRDFLRFVHEFRFTGVSNQMQGKAMYALWRKHLGLHELFHDVEDELRSGSDYLLAIENREQTDASLRLNIIAGLGVALGLPLAFATTNGFRAFVNGYLHGEWFAGLGITMLFTLVIALGYGLLSLRSETKHIKRLLCYFLVPILMAIVLITTLWIDIPQPEQAKPSLRLPQQSSQSGGGVPPHAGERADGQKRHERLKIPGDAH